MCEPKSSACTSASLSLGRLFGAMPRPSLFVVTQRNGKDKERHLPSFLDLPTPVQEPSAGLQQVEQSPGNRRYDRVSNVSIELECARRLGQGHQQDCAVGPLRLGVATGVRHPLGPSFRAGKGLTGRGSNVSAQCAVP